MPFYEYECASCKFYTEVMQKITDAPLKKCPSCGKGTLRKLVSAPVFRLKGGGWYETDFKSDKEAKRNLAGESEPQSKAGDNAVPADAKAADGKSEAKAGAKAATEAAGAKSPDAKAPAAKAPKAARKTLPKSKARAGKRRGR
ncbi:MAG TPA: zinc ribbon domain-containing protein [Steroidobacteraceae bacterium]|nr:zinc ribbon domain-containing protein [Steroidobacteraceae bacterium]